MLEDDVTRLRREHPGWQIGTVWATAASGPDVRRLTATRNGILLTAWDAAELSCKIGLEEESGEVSPRPQPGISGPTQGAPP